MKKRNTVIFIILFIFIFGLIGCDSDSEDTDFTIPDLPNLTGDNVSPSQDNPGGFLIDDVPQFVTIGFDDNGNAANLTWIKDELFNPLKKNPANGNASTYDGESISASFYVTGTYSGSAGSAWKLLQDAGHEIGNHSQTHPHSFTTNGGYRELFNYKSWQNEISNCNNNMGSFFINTSSVFGFRSPFLEYTDSVFAAVILEGLIYDCSIEEGWQSDQDGSNFFWPYTLDDGSPGNQLTSGWTAGRDAIGSFPGLWEMPLYVLIVPPSLIAKCSAVSYFDPSDPKITGMDWNLYYGYKFSDDDVLTILKFNLDLRLDNNGNRAPFMYGAHSDYYSDSDSGKRDVLEDFLEYALLDPEVRIVSIKKILDWCKNPVELN